MEVPSIIQPKSNVFTQRRKRILENRPDDHEGIKHFGIIKKTRYEKSSIFQIKKSP
jgi:hypothetical protein